MGGASGGAVGAQNGAARVSGGACVAVFPGSGSESSEEQEAEEVALAEGMMAVLAFNCPPSRFTNVATNVAAAGGIPAGSSIAVMVELLRLPW